MNRKKFLKKGLFGAASIATLPTLLTSCNDDEITDSKNCEVSPTEIAGPFPIKTPTDWIRENIIGDRAGIPLKIIIKIENINANCEPLVGAKVDIWHCDALGNYSEYKDQIDGDFTTQHFLRGRQTTDTNGLVSFISIYPGWYPGRAPHLHLEIKSESGKSLLITQTSFNEDISNLVYSASPYKGNFDTPNNKDESFGDNSKNLPDSLTGNLTDGYTYEKYIKVSA